MPTENASPTLRCLQANLRHSQIASLNLSKLIIDMKLDIVLIQEPYVRCKNGFLHIPFFSESYKIFHSLNSKDYYYGAIILVRKELQAAAIEGLCLNHAVAIEVQSIPRNLSFFSVYCRPSICITETLKEFNSLPPSFFINTIISVDSNAHSTLWNSKFNDKRGDVFETFINNHDLNILNSSQCPQSIHTSFVDVTLSGDHVKCKSWKYLSDESFSDHPFIFFEIDSIPTPKPQRKYVLPMWSHVFQDKFFVALKANIDKILDSNLNSKKDVDSMIESVTKAIVSSARSNCQQNPPTKHKDIDWWKPHLYGLRHKLRSLRKQMLSNPSESLTVAYKAAKGIYQRELRKAKREFFKEYCSNLSNKDVFSIGKKLERVSCVDDFPCSLKNGANLITDREIIADVLLQSFFPDLSGNEITNKQIDIMTEMEDVLQRARGTTGPLFTSDELFKAVKELNDKASPGIDCISMQYVKSSIQVLAPVLIKIMNACVTLQYFPEKWKIAKVRIIRKPNKETYDEPKSFRPISVPNSLGKVFENMILYRLRWLSNKLKWISENQHGFTEGRSTETATHTLVNYVEYGFSTRSYTGALFIDITSAFDRAWGPAIIRALYMKDCPLYLINLVNSYLCDRKASLSLGRLRRIRTVTLGCPQGGILSPFLWNVLLDDIIRQNFRFYFKIIAYADDIVVLVRHIDPKILAES